MSIVFAAALKTLYVAFNIYVNLIIIAVIFDWLRVLNIINPYNRFVYMIGTFLYKITNPAYRLIRKVVPPIGNLDLSPIILILIIFFLQNIIIEVMRQWG